MQFLISLPVKKALRFRRAFLFVESEIMKAELCAPFLTSDFRFLIFLQSFTEISSTSKISTELGPMTLLAACSP